MALLKKLFRISPVRMLVVLGAVSVVSLVLFQTFTIIQAYNANESSFKQQVYVALDSTARKLAALSTETVPDSNLVEQLSGNYFIVHSNSSINTNWLEYYLRQQLLKRGVISNFEYGIYDCSNDKVVYGGYVSLDGTSKDKDQQARTDLPRYGQIPHYFAVRFPDRSNYLYSGLGLSIASSGITILVLCFFAYALFIILEQKRYAEIQRDFINNMTHELKTPITTIGLTSSAALRPEIQREPERLGKYLNIIKKESERLNTLVDRVLRAAQDDRKGLKLDKHSVDVKELFSEVANAVTLSSRGQDGVLMLDLPDGPLNVVADRMHLCNVLHNLLENAVKYSNRPPELRLRAQPMGKHLYIEVQDNGKGIEERYHRKIFKKFFRVPTGNLHNVKGFGLGLEYVMRVVREHRWGISIISFPGQGTVFTLKARLA